jgi:hypothetical protein
LVQTLGGLSRSGITIDPPGLSDLAEDAWVMSYDSEVDCMLIRLFPDAGLGAPFRNRQAPVEVFGDYGGRLCGLRITLTEAEAAAVERRAGQTGP